MPGMENRDWLTEVTGEHVTSSISRYAQILEESIIHQQHRIVYIIVIYVFCTLLKHTNNQSFFIILFNCLQLMHILSFPFFLGINNTKQPINNCENLIFPNCRFSLINSLNTCCFISVNLYIKKNLKLVFGFRLII